MHNHDPFARVFWTFWFYKRGNTAYGVSLTNHGIQFRVEQHASSESTEETP